MLLLLIVTQMKKKGRREDIDSSFDAADGVRAGHWVCCVTARERCVHRDERFCCVHSCLKGWKYDYRCF